MKGTLKSWIRLPQQELVRRILSQTELRTISSKPTETPCTCFLTELYMRDQTKVFSYHPFNNRLPFHRACQHTEQIASFMCVELPKLWLSPQQWVAVLLAGCHIHWFHLQKVTVKTEEAGLVPITLFSS